MDVPAVVPAPEAQPIKALAPENCWPKDPVPAPAPESKGRKLLFQLFGGLILESKAENKDGSSLWVVSLGRVAFWTVFIHMVACFIRARPLMAEELNVFYSLLAYQGVKLGKSALTDTAEACRAGGGPKD